LDVTVPVGIRDGQNIRLKGKGSPGLNGGPAGDAYVRIEVRPHPLFRREGRDILIDLPITLDEAVLGGKVAVPTIHGKINMSVPAGASSGDRKSTRLNSSHVKISYAVFCLKKKTEERQRIRIRYP